MNISTRAKALVGAVAITGAAVAMGGAFTAGGLTSTATNDQFVGGTTGQTIAGANLTSVDYFTSDGLTVSQVDLTLDAAATGKTVEATFTDTAATPVDYAYNCVEVGTTAVYECTPAVDAAPTADGTTLSIVVSEPVVV